MARLSPRLETVAAQLRGGVHADVGSDHGHLLKALLESGAICRGIAIENKEPPFRRSTSALRGLPASVRFGDGLAELEPGEADSLSICGMGGVTIARILESQPDRVPRSVILQPNRRVDLVRIWGLSHQFHLVNELVCYGLRNYNVLCFQRSDGAEDPSYEGIDRDAAILLGPHQIRRKRPEFIADMESELHRLSKLAGRDEIATRKLRAVCWVLEQGSH